MGDKKNNTPSSPKGDTPSSPKGDTPMMKQYFSIKNEHPEAILFFRMGDFYETFSDDAVITARVLGITLTSRGREKGADIPLAGIPYHALDTYLHKMVKAGYTVAICEQMEDPKKAKGIVKRGVVRIVSPGTVVEDSMLSGSSNNFLASVSMGKVKGKGKGKDNESFGLALVDISTGEFLTTQIEDEDVLRNELIRFQPSEIISDPDTGTLLQRLVGDDIAIPLTGVDAYFYDLDNAQDKLLKLFKVKSLAGYGCASQSLAISAAGAVIAYLEGMQMAALGQIGTLRTYSNKDFMVLDATTLRNLELFNNIRDRSEKFTLIELLDRTKTPMGSRKIRQWLAQPLQNIGQINERLDSVEWLTDNRLTRIELRDYFDEIRDMERLVARAVHGSANARDMHALKNSLQTIPRIQALFNGVIVPSQMQHSIDTINPLDDLTDMLEKAIVDKPPLGLKDGGIIKDGFNADLDELKELASSGKKWVADLEAKERERTGIKSLKIKYNKVFGYFLEVTVRYADKVPENYIRKQTLSNAERFITPELKEKEAQILSANDRLVALEYDTFCDVRNWVAENSASLQSTARALGKLDVFSSLADISELYRYSRPKMVKGNTLSIIEGRHPVVERMLPERFISNDTKLDDKKNRLMILTGPNMAGKSTYMRQVALITLMAHIGSFVPARSANIGIVDRIFTRVGAYDDLTHGQSTFMVEMTEVANILNSATKKSLIILDEIGRGTSTFDGLSIAWAVAEYIESKRVAAKAIFATHYHHLTELEELLGGVVNYNIAVKEDKDDIIFLRKVIPGSTNRSYGIQVGKLAGLPIEVVERAKEILKRIEAEAVMELEDGGAKRGKRRQYTQLVLYDQPENDNPAVKELKELDPDHMTPMEALHKLQELKKKVGK